MKIIQILIAVVLMLCFVWAAGFAWFSVSASSMRPHDLKEAASAIVVLTGGDRRIDVGLDLFSARRGMYLFITSVDPSITEQDIRSRWKGENDLPVCCIVLDYDAETTAHNAQMTKAWIDDVRARGDGEIESIRLVTSNYHMPRSLIDFDRILPELTLYPHPVVSDAARSYDQKYWILLLREYHKFMFRLIQKQLPDFAQGAWL